jgi:hypothetical protein
MDEPNDQFDELLDDAVHSYNRPPNQRHIPFDAMWEAVEAQAFPGNHRFNRRAQWLRIAAALVIGVGIGRLPFAFGHQPHPSFREVSSASSSRAAISPVSRQVASSDTTAQPFDLETSRYLGQASALLIALPAETNAGRPDQPFINRANDLLLTTRLLLDSPSAADPRLRNLLEDLELVLVQVVRLQKEHAPTRRTEMELIQQALDQRDVIPRLRSAVSDYAAD